MQQAAVGESLSFDPLPFEQDRLPASKVDVGGGEVVEALVSAGMIVVRHKGPDLRQSAGKIVVLQQDAVLERLMPALDLALGLRMAGSPADVPHAPALKPCGQITRDVA